MIRLLVFLAAIGVSAPLCAAAYPQKPVTIIVPFPLGGSSDTTARFLAQELARWKAVVDKGNLFR